MLPIEQVGELLSLIPEEKRISFDQTFAEELYRKFNESKVVDDISVVNDLKAEFLGKKVLLVAPGKKAGENLQKIKEILQQDDVISIGLNSTFDLDFDYLITTRKLVRIKNKCLNRIQGIFLLVFHILSKEY
jgi:4-hydroxy 2-oxovalerate aldolase